MERKTYKGNSADGGEIKRISGAEHDLFVQIPLVVGIGVVRVQPPIAIVVPLDVERLRIAVGIGNVRNAIHFTAR